MAAEHLSTALFRETRGAGFFRVLAGKNAPFYVDVLDRLDHESSDRADGIAREEAVAIIVETLEAHPDFDWDADLDGPDAATREQDTRTKARTILEHLLKCRWLDEPPRRDWRRNVHFDAHGGVMLAALRKIAWPDAAVFTDKLTGVCAMLANESELGQRPWETVETCLANAREGLNELRAMQKSVQRFTRLQMEEETLRGNLANVFDEYSEQITTSCYASLVRARLPLRLPEAVARIHQRLADDAGALAAMQTEVLRRNPGLDAATARANVHQALDDLTDLLERVLPMADEIDRRTADFTRRSLARFRYLQDVTGERRTELRAFFEQANRHLAGRRVSQAAHSLAPLPDFLLPAIKLPAGLDSLYSPPTRRTPVEQEAFDDGDLTDSDRQAGLHDMERVLRESLTIQRANATIRALPGTKGDRISSDQLPPVENEKSLADLIAILLHAEATEAIFRIETDRTTTDAATPPVDTLHTCSVERFAIIKK
jgi:hypothetical protein